MAYTGVMMARADVCEILAMKLLNQFSSSKIELSCVLMVSWNPLAGASEDVLGEVETLLGGNSDQLNDPQCALEVSSLQFYPPNHVFYTHVLSFGRNF